MSSRTFLAIKNSCGFFFVFWHWTCQSSKQSFITSFKTIEKELSWGLQPMNKLLVIEQESIILLKNESHLGFSWVRKSIKYSMLNQHFYLYIIVFRQIFSLNSALRAYKITFLFWFLQIQIFEPPPLDVRL